MKFNSKVKFILITIFIFASLFRFYGVNWDQGAHLHPDERAIVMAVVDLKYPQNLSQFLSPESPWNPHFFAYGSFPFYLLKFSGQLLSFVDPRFAQYDLINIAGRYLSVISDLLTLIILFRLGRKLFSENIGLLAAFFYAISVLPIQLSHFYAVDTLLTFLILTTLYELLIFYERPGILRGIFIGFLFGLALATKVSSVIVIVPIITTLTADFLISIFKHRGKKIFSHLGKFLVHFLLYTGVIGVITGITFAVFEPYALIDFKNFWLQTMQQSAMTHNAFIFPYTLQYVNKIPYLYELKNMYFYGFGPFLSLFTFAGTIYFTISIVSREKHAKSVEKIILLSFFFPYFFIVGKFAVGFMRYMLPVYPLFCLFGATILTVILSDLRNRIQNKIILNTLYVILYIILLIWPASFIQIYTQNNPRVEATFWINQRIPLGSAIAVEHWDDPLPLSGSQQYQILTLPLYDPDTTEKWMGISQQLRLTDYIILSSNRLYTPLQKLTDCQHLPSYKCYPITAEYYKNLFAGKNVSPEFIPELDKYTFSGNNKSSNTGPETTVRFKEIKEFTDYPTVPLLNIPINDQGADESFTVYDHPKVIIFKKI